MSRDYTTFWYNKSVSYRTIMTNYMHLTDTVDFKGRPLLLLADVPPPQTNGCFTKTDNTGFLLCDYAIYLISFILPMRLRNGVAILSNISSCSRSELDVVTSFLRHIEDFKRVDVTFYGLSTETKASLHVEFLKNLVLVPNFNALSRYIPTSQLPPELFGVFHPYFEPWIKFIENFKAFEEHISKQFNKIMMIKEHRTRKASHDTGLLQQQISISGTLDTEIISNCNKVLSKLNNNQRYFGLIDMAINPAFVMALEKVIFYKSILRLELDDIPSYSHSPDILQENHKSTQTLTDGENCRPKSLAHMAKAVKLIQLKNEAKSKRSEENSLESKLKILLNQRGKILQERTSHQNSFSRISEPSTSFLFSKHLQSPAKSAGTTCEIFTQTYSTDLPNVFQGQPTNERYYEEYIEKMDNWYVKALSAFEDIDDVSLKNLSTIPEEMILKVEKFFLTEPLDGKLFYKTEELAAGSREDVRDCKMLSYRINCLEKIMVNIRKLTLPDIEEVLFWRKQLKTSTAKISQSTLEPTRKKTTFEFHPHETTIKNYQKYQFNDDTFNDFMENMNKTLAQPELEKEGEKETKPGGEITLEDVDYDDFLNEISKYLKNEQTFLSLNIDENTSRVETNRFKDTKSPKENIQKNRILEDYDFTSDIFNGSSDFDDIILRPPDPKQVESNHRFDFQYLLPPSLENPNGKHFHDDTRKSIDSGIWNTSPI